MKFTVRHAVITLVAGVIVIGVSLRLKTMEQPGVSQGAQASSAGDGAARPLASLKRGAAEKIVAGFTEDQKKQVVAGTFDWNSLNLPKQAEDEVKIAFARDNYLKTGTDLSQQFGVDIGGFSITELLKAGRIPAAVPENGMLGLGNAKIGDMTGFRDIKDLNTLKSLFLQGNRLRELPKEIFAGLDMLHQLYLQFNHELTIIPVGLFTGLKLKLINFGGCSLRELPAELFSGQSDLGVLHLNDNQLKELPAEIFSGLNNLNYLFLNNNKLQKLPSFVGLNKLEHLYLGNNQLKELPVGTFAGLNNLKTLQLLGNPLQGIRARQYRGQELQDLLARLR